MVPPMIWDLVTYAGEKDMLRLRLEEMADLSDVHHVVVEGDRTFRGAPRQRTIPLEMYGPWTIESLLVLLEGDDAWAREKFQRDAPLHPHALLADKIAPDDIVLVCDIDEIPRRSIVEKLPAIFDQAAAQGYDGPLGLEMRMHYYSPRWRAPNPWYHAKAARRRHVDELHGGSLDSLRMSKPPGIKDAGWHLTYFGGEEAVHAKLRAFSHSEFDTPEWHAEVPRWIAEGTNMHGEALVEYVGDDWPRGFRP